MNTWLNVSALWKVVVFGLILGAGLPALFAVGVRSSIGTSTAGGGTATAQRNPVGNVIATVCFAIVAVAVVLGVLFIARDFIGHHTGWYILGAKQK